jgi:hypothetical protein
VLQGMGFEHFPQLKQLFCIGLVKLLHAPLTAFFTLDKIVTSEF